MGDVGISAWFRQLLHGLERTPPGRAVDARTGGHRRWRQHWRSTRPARPTSETIERLAPHVEDAEDTPILVFSATWRAGSTLLQRLVMSDGQTLLWGEPWNRTDLVPRLRESLAPIDGAWPVPGTTIDAFSVPPGEQLWEQWVANLHPSPSDLVESHRALLRRLLGESARARGFPRWGAKWVRLGADDGRYLRLLFPRAPMLLVYRDPYESWASYRAKELLSYVRWPGDPVITPSRFGRLWADRVGRFLDAATDLELLLVPYESLCDDPELMTARVAEHVGADLDAAVLARPVGATHHAPLEAGEVRAIRRHVEPVLARLDRRPR